MRCMACQEFFFNYNTARNNREMKIKIFWKPNKNKTKPKQRQKQRRNKLKKLDKSINQNKTKDTEKKLHKL